MTIVYTKTKKGQLLYDLAFTDLEASYLARKHHKPVARIRNLRNDRHVKALRQQNGLSNKPVGMR